MTVLGSHEQSVRCVEYNASTGTLLSGGWDAKLNSWDPRSKQPLVQSRPAPGKVCACWACSLGACVHVPVLVPVCVLCLCVCPSLVSACV